MGNDTTNTDQKIEHTIRKSVKSNKPIDKFDKKEWLW